MSIVSNPPTSPTVAASIGSVSPGLATGLRTKINDIAGSVDAKTRAIQTGVEQLTLYLGNGAITGGSVGAGSALSVTVQPYTAVVGNVVANDAVGTVGGLTASTTNHIWLRQDGTWSANTTGTVPGTADGHGTAIHWASAVAGTATISSVDNNRQYWSTGGSALTRHTYEGWYADNVVAGTTAQVLNRLSGVAQGRWLQLMRGGHVTGVGLYCNAAGTAGTMTATLYLNNVAQALVAQVDRVNTQQHIGSANVGEYPFSALTPLDVRITTSADWAPTTIDIRCLLEVTM